MHRCNEARVSRLEPIRAFCKFCTIILSDGYSLIRESCYRDLKSMVKILSGVLILRNGKATEWTSEVDDGFVSWAKAYIPWLQTNKLAIEERDSTKYVSLRYTFIYLYI